MQSSTPRPVGGAGGGGDGGRGAGWQGEGVRGAGQGGCISTTTRFNTIRLY